MSTKPYVTAVIIMVQTSRKQARKEKAADTGKHAYQLRTRRNNLDIGLYHALSIMGANSKASLM